MTKNIILVGFMGSGKTTVGKELAKMLDYDFVDTDYLVENKEQMSIATIFEEKGEVYFRRCETQALEMALGQSDTIIATGGGIVTIEENAKILKEGIVVYLEASANQIYDHVKDDRSRPLLQSRDVYGKITSMLNDRQALYKGVAHYTVQVDGKTPEEICTLILGGIQ